MKLHEIVDRLKSTGVKPIKEFVASGGKNYGYICVFKINKKYIIQCFDGISFFYDVADSVESLNDWIDLLCIDKDILHELNIRGINFIDSAEPSDDGPFNILEVRYWNDGFETVDLVRDIEGVPIIFTSYQGAEEWIKKEDNRIYYLSHNECSRPSYKIINQLPLM